MNKPFVERLRKHLKAVPVLLSAIEPELIEQKPANGKWSKKEILGHLVDSAVYNLTRFTSIRFSEEPFKITPYAQKELVEANAYQKQSTTEILQLWKTINQQILAVWDNYAVAELRKKVLDPVSGNEGDLEWWINDYTEHLEHHLRQVLGAEYQDLTLWLATSEAAEERLRAATKPFVKLLEHGSMYVEYYVPEGEDLQTPHEQDELYVIDQGSGVFYNDGVRHTFKAGDVLFVPAGIEHRFEVFSVDFATWVIFYGPKGGELAHH